VAPLAQGERVGTVKITTAGGAPLANLPLVVQQPVELAGILSRSWDSLRLWIR
jgi:D-alanyl-D-alanine carboxypeptidase (penicillin-binding protein 5/6)